MFEYNKLAEDKIREFWTKENIAEKFRRKNEDSKKTYYLMDGPPYASGHIHLGTALNKTLKDVTLRYKTYRGYDVYSRVGYDTHGLPIENKVEKELGLKDKEDIEKYGIANFVNKCIEFATYHIKDMTEAFDNLGVWMQLQDPYLTLDPEYVEGLWVTFKNAHEKGLLYKGKYPVHVCPHCGTAVAYNEIVYNEITDNSVYVKFPLVGRENEYLLIWTTTPWTLPANVGVMAGPEYIYVRVKVGEEIWIMAEKLVSSVFRKINKPYEIVGTLYGSDLEDLRYINPLSDKLETPKFEDAYRVVLSKRYVNLDDGTGLVHCAPGHGKEDFEVGMQTRLPIYCPVTITGVLDESTGKYNGLKALDANSVIVNDLNESKHLLAEDKISHDYPMCWRCNSKLLMVSLPQWFFKVSAIKDELITHNEDVNWVPKWGKDRFKNWLENLNDWPVSRNRYWGTPLPIWVCDKCEKYDVIGTYDELDQKTKTKLDRTIIGIHRPNIDKYEYNCECGGTKKRVLDVLDVWFDSGATSWGALHYPRYDDLFKKYWPADFNVEGSDQFRGWWNSQIILSQITFGKKPFKNVMVHGMVLDINKREMHKSWGNVITPEEIIDKHGRDFLRYFMVKESKGEDFAFNEALFKDIARFINIVSNTANYMYTYLDLNLDNITAKNLPDKLHAEDKWILSRFNSVKLEILNAYDGYIYNKVPILLESFLVDDFSRTYLKIVKDRTDKENLSKVMSYVFGNIVRLLAPIMPHYAEFIYKEFNFGTLHTTEITDADTDFIDKNLETEMNLVMKLVQPGLKLREQEKLRLRWTLPSVNIIFKNKDLKIKELNGVLKSMLNVGEIEYSSPNGSNCSSVSDTDFTISVSKSFDSKTKDLWFMQELRRAVQDQRKLLGFNPNDNKQLEVYAEASAVSLIKENLKLLEKDTNTKVALFETKEIKEDFKDKPIIIFEKEIRLKFV